MLVPAPISGAGTGKSRTWVEFVGNSSSVRQILACGRGRLENRPRRTYDVLCKFVEGFLPLEVQRMACHTLNLKMGVRCPYNAVSLTAALSTGNLPERTAVSDSTLE